MLTSPMFAKTGVNMFNFELFNILLPFSKKVAKTGAWGNLYS